MTMIPVSHKPMRVDLAAATLRLAGYTVVESRNARGATMRLALVCSLYYFDRNFRRFQHYVLTINCDSSNGVSAMHVAKACEHARQLRLSSNDNNSERQSK